MTPAAELLAAADRLEALAGAATEGPWETWPWPDATLVCTSVDHCTCGGGGEFPHEPGCGLEEPPGIKASHEDARYIAAMGPDRGLLLVALLRELADWPSTTAALDLARAINRG